MAASCGKRSQVNSDVIQRQVGPEAPLRVIDLRTQQSAPITEFASVGAAAARLASGGGAAHVYVVQIAPGGEIGLHEAGFDQLFVPVQGTGWVADAAGVRHRIEVGQAAVFRRGEHHAKGSETGLVALVVQVAQLAGQGAAG